MIQYNFRKAAHEDIPNLTKLCKETMREVYGQILPQEKLGPWVEGDMAVEAINRQWKRMIVAENAGKIVGTAARDEDKIDLLWVHPAHHRKGIGSGLLEIIESDLKKSGYVIGTLECFSDNHRALEFYRARGWKPICREMDDEAGAFKIVMTKTLQQPKQKIQKKT